MNVLLDPDHSTLDPNHSTLDPDHSTLYPHHSALDPHHSTLDPDPHLDVAAGVGVMMMMAMGGMLVPVVLELGRQQRPAGGGVDGVHGRVVPQTSVDVRFIQEPLGGYAVEEDVHGLINKGLESFAMFYFAKGPRMCVRAPPPPGPVTHMCQQ